MESNKNTLVVVLSRNYSTGLSVIRSLGEAGYTVDLVASAFKEGKADGVRQSKYIRNSLEVVTKKVKDTGDPELINALLAYKDTHPTKPVLLPTDDYTTSIMDMSRDVLEDIFIMPEIIGGGQGSLKHHMDKSVQGEIARRVGILVPPEWVISLRDEDIKIPEDMIYPCYCKPLESSLGYKLEMAKCHNEGELLAHLKKLRRNFSERSILVQEFLNIDEEIDLEGVCIDQEIVLPAIIWKRIVAQHDKGVPLAGRTYPTEELGEMRDKVIAMLKEFHYLGMFDLGLHLVGDKFYFNEINMRSGGTNFVYFKSGVNLPDIFVKEATGRGHTPEDERVEEFGRSYFYEKVAWADYLNGYMTKEELEENNASADITFMCNKDDPLPGDIFMKEILEEAEMERIRQQREVHITAVMEKTGWDHDQAEAKMRAARIERGILYKDYAKYEFWNYAEENQAAEYEKILARREKQKQQREAHIASVMEASGWDHDFAEQQMKASRQAIGIVYKDYVRYEFWKLSDEEQAAEYEKILARREKQKQQREAHIASVMEITGWDHDHAQQQMKEAKKNFGVSYKDFVSFELWKYSGEEQAAQYKKKLARRERIKQQREACITSAMEKAGWDREYAEAQIKDARERLGITYVDYMENDFCLIPVKKQSKKYDKILKKKSK